MSTAQSDAIGVVDGLLKGDKYTRTTVASKTGTTGEVLVSTNNTPKYGVADFFDLDRDTDGSAFDDVRPGQLVDFQQGSASRIVGIVRGSEVNPNDASGHLFWYESLYSRGLDQYGQPAAGQTATVEFGVDIDDVFTNLAELRAGLPIGNQVADDALSTDTEFLLKSFGFTSLGQLVEWHDEHHTGKHSITGLLYNTSSGVTDAGDINVSGNLVTVNPVNAAMSANIKARILAGREIVVRQSASVYVSGVCNAGVSTLFGKLSFNLTNDSTLETAGTFLNNHAITLEFVSNIPARSEFADVAFSGKGADVTIDASGFDGNLATTDTDVQKVAQKVDDLTVSGGSGLGAPEYAFTATDGSSHKSSSSPVDTGITIDNTKYYLIMGYSAYHKQSQHVVVPGSGITDAHKRFVTGLSCLMFYVRTSGNIGWYRTNDGTYTGDMVAIWEL